MRTSKKITPNLASGHFCSKSGWRDITGHKIFDQMREHSRVHSRKQRLAILLLAERVGVSKASRETGVSRSTIYEWRQRFEEQGADGLAPLPTTPRAHPQTTAKRDAEQITQLALAHPGWGCDRIEKALSASAPSVTSTTIQKILNKNGLGTRAERSLALQKRVEDKRGSLSEEQHDFVSGRNPCFPKCSYPTRRPGDAMLAGIWRLGKTEDSDEVYVLAMVDLCSAFAFGAIVESRSMSQEVSTLDLKVRDFYRRRHLRVHKILVADNFSFLRVGLYASAGSLSCVGAFIGYFRRPPIGRPCCLIRFQKIVMTEFIRSSNRRKKNIDVGAMNRDFQKWLECYNWSRAHEGYPNWGKVPGNVFG